MIPARFFKQHILACCASYRGTRAPALFSSFSSLPVAAPPSSVSVTTTVFRKDYTTYRFTHPGCRATTMHVLSPAPHHITLPCTDIRKDSMFSTRLECYHRGVASAFPETKKCTVYLGVSSTTPSVGRDGRKRNSHLTFGSHAKYVFPSTVPLQLPTASSSSTPTCSPGAKCTSPA